MRPAVPCCAHAGSSGGFHPERPGLGDDPGAGGGGPGAGAAAGLSRPAAPGAALLPDLHPGGTVGGCAGLGPAGLRRPNGAGGEAPDRAAFRFYRRCGCVLLLAGLAGTAWQWWGML
ncbi:hypothetical protein ACFQU7_18420 [Pseudoroseomonas wenyumeiae]